MPVRVIELAAASIFVVGIWVAIIPHWRRGVDLILLFMPIAGAVELWLYPASWGVLIKDILFVIPVYAGFVMSGELKPALAGVPKSFGTIVLLFAGIVLVQALNPSCGGIVSRLIGLKVWLFYVPVFLLARAYVHDRDSLLRISRLMIGMIWLPCTVGILQWLLSLALGYQRAITIFYGEAAAAATQNFAQFNSVGLMRIPGTFSFATQYLDYLLCMFVPVLGCIGLEKNKFWQKAGLASLALICISGFMTGERSAFVMIPLMLGSFYLLRHGATGVIWVTILVASALMVVLSISGIDPTALLHMETDLTGQYAGTQAGEIGDALQETWIGRGVGTNTGASRAVTDDPEEAAIYEGYYAKAVAELGIAGCIIAVANQLVLLVLALRARSSLRGTELEPYCDAIAAIALICLVYSYKGPIMSLDPPNSLFWLFSGVLFSLPEIADGRARDFSHAEGWWSRRASLAILPQAQGIRIGQRGAHV